MTVVVELSHLQLCCCSEENEDVACVCCGWEGAAPKLKPPDAGAVPKLKPPGAGAVPKLKPPDPAAGWPVWGSPKPNAPLETDPER